MSHPKGTIERQLFKLLIFAAFALGVAYMYFVSMSIVNVVVREETEIRIAEVSSKVSELESGFLLANEEISYAFALSQGFVPTSGTVFVARVGEGQGLSLNRE